MTVSAALDARDQGIAQALRADRVQVWKIMAGGWFNQLPIGAEFTADRLVAAVGKPDEGVYRANAIGALISSWSKRGLIDWTGRFAKSERVEGHGNLQRVWRRTLEAAEDAGGSSSASSGPQPSSPVVSSSQAEAQLDLFANRKEQP